MREEVGDDVEDTPSMSAGIREAMERKLSDIQRGTLIERVDLGAGALASKDSLIDLGIKPETALYFEIR